MEDELVKEDVTSLKSGEDSDANGNTLNETTKKNQVAVSDYCESLRKSEPRIVTDKRGRYLKFESPYE